ncbi:MAG TPA: Na-translocating system protein MpsC family protein [Conexibacter sp.]|nr:Na-translocating system protein MpsC family protein [Conexibacter sp.]
MVVPDGFLDGDELLDAVSAAMSALHERYYGRVPANTKSRMMGEDLLACVLGGVYNDVEKTMIELERSAIVQETRSAFQTAMQHKFIAEVERLSGRRVLAFISNHHVGPDLEIELFVLATPS